MNPAHLISRTAARGASLEPGRLTKDPTHREKVLYEQRLSRQMYPRSVARSDIIPHAPEWGTSEAALACHGLDRCYFHALCYSYAGDDSVRGALKRALLVWFEQTAARQRWPLDIVSRKGVRPYAGNMVEMHLREERHPAPFKQSPGLWAVLMNVDVEIWARHLSPRYEELRAEYMRWLKIGELHMRDWLSEEEFAEAA